jgi:DNA-binding NarL/FixJ family response regulator
MLSKLSAREREVMHLVVKGLSNKEISHRLSISDKTVQVHLQNIYRKLAIRNRTRLAVMVATLPASQGDLQSTAPKKKHSG